jgi:hypothetical protein
MQGGGERGREGGGGGGGEGEREKKNNWDGRECCSPPPPHTRLSPSLPVCQCLSCKHTRGYTHRDAMRYTHTTLDPPLLVCLALLFLCVFKEHQNIECPP